MTEKERWTDKYDALQKAHEQQYGSKLPWGGVVLGLCPAQLETRCGDAWPGPDGLVGTDDDERNWGACTLRSLNAAEHACLKAAGLAPTIGSNHVEVERKAMAALAAAGLPKASGTVANGTIDVPSATIHCDSRTVKDPVTGKATTIPHFVWFANFASHVDGARYYLHLLGSEARAVLARSGSSYELAAAMYRRGYYGGFKPHGIYKASDGTEHDGNAENIAAYQRLIDYWRPKIVAVLTKPPEPVVPTYNLDTSNGLATALKVVLPDCDLVPLSSMRKFCAWVGVYQHGRSDVDGKPLKVDGDAGPKTRAALLRDCNSK